MTKCADCSKRLATQDPAALQRRDLLRVGVAGAAVLLGPAACGPSSGTGDAGGAAPPSCTPTCAGGTGTLVLPFGAHPELSQVGGWANVQAPGYKDPVWGLDFVIVVQPSAGQYVAFSGTCTHAGCQVQFVNGQFHCPCHGSVYDIQGRRIAGPAPQNLAKLDACADGCGVVVTLA